MSQCHEVVVVVVVLLFLMTGKWCHLQKDSEGRSGWSSDLTTSPRESLYIGWSIMSRLTRRSDILRPLSIACPPALLLHIFGLRPSFLRHGIGQCYPLSAMKLCTDSLRLSGCVFREGKDQGATASQGEYGVRNTPLRLGGGGLRFGSFGSRSDEGVRPERNKCQVFVLIMSRRNWRGRPGEGSHGA
jgi:hypothetical protein